jgi:hypothetical protein
MILNWPDKDPQETLDYRLNWRARVPAGDKIISSVWSSPTGITKGVNTYTDYTTTLWLSEGIIDSTYVFTNTITTEDGRIMEQSVQVTVVSK